MPWTESLALDERKRFISDYIEGFYNNVELCRRYGVSRKTGYKWIERFKQEGMPGLGDRSRAPKSCPHQTSPEIQELLLDARRKHPTWGPEKLVAWLSRRHSRRAWPSAGTISRLFARKGLVARRRRRRRHVHPGAPSLVTEAPNDIWTADFKGHFRTGDGVYCYALTVADQHSCMILACVGMLHPNTEGCRPVFEELFRKYGLPKAIRTDNGAPFASNGLHGFTELSVWWLSLGIQHQRIRPASPQENGRHERMHRTLKQETCLPPRASLRAQQKAFDAFVLEFNHERPHAALGGDSPASKYRASSRPLPRKPAPQEYPGHYIVKRVQVGGHVRFGRGLPFIATTLANYLLGFEEVEDGVWNIYFNQTLIAKISEKDYKVRP